MQADWKMPNTDIHFNAQKLNNTTGSFTPPFNANFATFKACICEQISITPEAGNGITLTCKTIWTSASSYTLGSDANWMELISLIC